MKYKANPVIVDAFQIVGFGMEILEQGIVVHLDNGGEDIATKEMTARMTPKTGDYWVKQEDGYVYLNPKDVFERKYSKISENENEWELITKTPLSNVERLKVDGGHIYRSASDVPGNGISEALVFVPDIDLTRYQAHLRDAYNQGFKDGSGEIRMEPNTTAYNRGYEDAKKDIEFESQKVAKNV